MDSATRLNATTKVTPNPKLGMSAKRITNVHQKQHLFSPKASLSVATAAAA